MDAKRHAGFWPVRWAAGICLIVGSLGWTAGPVGASPAPHSPGVTVGGRVATAEQRIVWARFYPADGTVGLLTADVDGDHVRELTHPGSWSARH